MEADQIGATRAIGGWSPLQATVNGTGGATPDGNITWLNLVGSIARGDYHRAAPTRRHTGRDNPAEFSAFSGAADSTSRRAHGAEIRPGQRFSYSWQEAGRGVSGCGAPILSTMRTLSAPAGATLLLTIAEDIPLNGIVIRPTPLNAQGKRETTPFSAELPLRFADSHAEIVAALPPGDYLLAVYTRLPNGSADYGFRITITP